MTPLAKNSLLAQYPVTKVLKGDTVVIMLKSQADEINRVFAAQREKIEQTTQTTVVLNTNIDSLYNWMSTAAKYNGLLFITPWDSSLKLIDLRYHTMYVKRNSTIKLQVIKPKRRPEWDYYWENDPKSMTIPHNLFDNIREKYILRIHTIPKL